MSSEGMVYVDQSPDALNLAGAMGELDTSNLEVLGRLDMNHDVLNLQAFIIGASHYFKVSDANAVCLTEILACIKPPAGADFEFSLQQLPHVCRRDSKALTYMMTREVIRGDASASAVNDFRRRQQTGDRRGLWIVFPGDDQPFVPVTGLSARRVERGFIVETLHAYPNHNTVVLTASDIQPKG